MKQLTLQTILIFLLVAVTGYAQFGRNKVQYKGFEWYYIQTKHFDIYFDKQANNIVEFAAKEAEAALSHIERDMHFRITERIALILYYSQNDFQETNVIDSYLSEGIGGFTELFKNRVVLPFTGDYKAFRHVIHHELVHAVTNDMFYGGSIQSVLSGGGVQFPLWFAEGSSEYFSLGWDTHSDMFIRDAAINEYLPPINGLDGYFAYRGGQAVMKYIANTYGREKLGEIFNKVKGKGNVEEGIKASIGIGFEELNDRWRKYIKREFWPDVVVFEDLKSFSKQLTNPKKDHGFYNTSPAISPTGEQIVFITNRDYYFDVYLMDAKTGEVGDRLVKGNRTIDFEELNILTPGLGWSPDGTKVVLSAKSMGFDVLYIIEVESEDVEALPLKLEGVQNVRWSPNGNHLLIAAHTSEQSDLYSYDLSTRELKNLTNDVFSDSDPIWSPDGRSVVFSSDRNGLGIKGNPIPDTFKMAHHNYTQRDLYKLDVQSGEILRVTDLPLSEETSPIYSSTGEWILFVSDFNGIDNIYKMKADAFADSTLGGVTPITNSLNGIVQLSITGNDHTLAFSALYEGSYNIFVMENPLEKKTELDSLPKTRYMAQLWQERHFPKQDSVIIANNISQTDTTELKKGVEFFSGSYVDSTQTYGDSVRIDLRNYVFGSKDDYVIADSSKDTIKAFTQVDNLDENGNYKVNRYQVSFSPDLVYANAGYSTYFGLLGTTVLSFSDMLGDHRLIGMTSLQIDLKNSDYGLAYYYLPNRMDLGVEAFHTARFVYLNRNGYSDLYRFRNYGGVFSASYPINRFNRVDAGLSFLNVSSENLDDTLYSTQTNSFLIPSVSYVNDNTIFGYTAPIDGTRFRIDLIANPFIDPTNYGFWTLSGDFRNYDKFWGDYSFATRFAFAYSDGASPQRFFLGGVENWINRKWAPGEIPIDSPADFAFLSSALPLRGYNYAERIGSKYSMINAEFRFPLIRYLVTGGLPLLFQNIIGVAFFDAGAAWNSNKQLQFFTRNDQNKLVSKDLLMGTGVGARLYFLYFLLKLDVAWSYNVEHFSKPQYYFSIGTDF